MQLVELGSALFAFQWSRIRTLLDDHFYTDRSEINLRDLKFEDFLEALTRVAAQKATRVYQVRFGVWVQRAT